MFPEEMWCETLSVETLQKAFEIEASNRAVSAYGDSPQQVHDLYEISASAKGKIF